MNDSILSCKNLSKVFGNKEIFSNINLEQTPGVITHLEGKNGSGKTTFIKIIAGLISQTNGQLFLHGEKYGADKHHLRSKIGYSPTNEDSFFLNSTVFDNLNFYFKILSLDKKVSAANEIERWADFFEISQFLNSPFQDLSTGYKKRCSLVRAFFTKPNLILLDEPLIGLDKNYKDTIFKKIEKWIRQNNASLIISEHNYNFHKDQTINF